GVAARQPGPAGSSAFRRGFFVAPTRRDAVKDWLNSAAVGLCQIARHKMVLVMLGGAVGTLLRYLIGKGFNEQGWTKGFPVGTLVINVSGSFILAVTWVMIYERLPPGQQHWYLLIGTGFCGGYTTFSTFEWETFRLVHDGSYLRALYNVVGSVV